MKINNVLFGLLFLIVACTHSSNSPISPKTEVIGTGDGGGGNGTANKIYESYIVDPLELTAYKSEIAPIMAHIDEILAVKGFSSADAESALGWKSFIRYKTWYIAPVELSTISKDVLGVSFSSDQTQQLAIQNDREIWMDSRVYPFMLVADQAALLIHEYMMSLYFLKYKSFTEMCHLAEQVKKENLKCASYAPLDALFPSQKVKPLSTEDYQNIRRVVSYIMLNGLTITREGLFAILLANNFDRRLFTDFNEELGSAPKHETVELDIAGLNEIYNYAEITKRVPDRCLFIQSNKESSCKVRVSNVGTLQNITMTNEDFSQTYADVSYLTWGHFFATSILDINSGTQLFLIPLPPPPIKKEPVVGDPFRTTILVAIQNPQSPTTNLRLSALISLYGVVTKVSTQNGQTQCAVDTVNPQSEKEETVIAYSDNKNNDYLKFLAKMSKLISPCLGPRMTIH